ncbi:MAG: bis(5'-nucleosyl)-tetraphosphatase (symmetrical) YqeK [Solobacterium sp.]|nr:bis(5'-nucleosyl)-tetraphosphatase (symmetrical) YqeK [Solobacterium sp.]
MRIVVCGSFDPVSKSEVTAVKEIRRKYHCREIYVFPEEEGILPRDLRKKFLEKAFRAYRHIHVTDRLSDDDISVQLTDPDEEKIRHGEYRLAAWGLPYLLFSEGYYLEETLKYMCKPGRKIHSYGVAETACMLARCHGVDQKEARIASLLHDITKKWTPEEGEKLLSVWNPAMLKMNPNVWHSYTAPVWIRQNMSIYNKRILKAIEHHTLGDGKSSLDRILYIADKIEPNRKYNTEKETALAVKDLKKGAELVLEEAKAYILEKEGIHV